MNSTRSSFYRRFISTLTLLTVASGSSIEAAGYIHTLHTPAAGDAQYEWNSRYAGEGYTGVGLTTVGCSTSFYGGIPSDTQYTVGIFMIPIASLAGGDLYSAELTVTISGFGSWYSYGAGTASIGWLNVPSSTVLTGDVQADGLGVLAKSRPSGFTIYDSYVGGSGTPGPISFNVLSAVSTDLAAGKAYSIFVLSASRDTGGSLLSAESGSGPYLTATSSIPEPATSGYVAGLALLVFVGGRRRVR